MFSPISASTTRSRSTSTGRAPTCSTTLTVAAKVNAVVITSSPGWIPSAIRLRNSPAVQHHRAVEPPVGDEARVGRDLHIRERGAPPEVAGVQQRPAGEPAELPGRIGIQPGLAGRRLVEQHL